MFGRVWLCVLLGLIAGGSARVASYHNPSPDQIKTQVSAWNTDKANKDHDPTHGAVLLQALLETRRRDVEFQAHSFARHALPTQDRLLPWLATHLQKLDWCFASDSQSNSAAREELASRFPLSTATRNKISAIVKRIPSASFLGDQLWEMPQVTLKLLRGIQGTHLGDMFAQRFHGLVNTTTQALDDTPIFLELRGNSITDSTFITSSITPVLESTGSLSNGEISEPLSSSINSLSGGGGSSAMLGGSADSGSEALTSVSAGGESSAGQSMGQLMNSEISSGTSVIYASSIPTSMSESLGTGTGSLTSFSTSSPSLLEISQTQSSGPDAKTGFCPSLISTVFVLGLGSAWDFFNANKFSVQHPEVYILRSVLEQASALSQQLEQLDSRDLQTSTTKTSLAKLMLVYYFGYNAVPAILAKHLDDYVMKILLLAVLGGAASK